MTHHTISIIVPLYNKVNEVCRAIDSIFAQTIQDFELIIVDGGSTDGSLDVIKKYEEDERYHLIHQKSKGVSGGRNEGILAASNELIAFLDADDEWLPMYLEEINELADMYPYAGLYATSTIPTYGTRTSKPPRGGAPNNHWRGILDPYFQIISITMQQPFGPSCATVPRTTFEKIGLFNSNFRIGEDTELWGRIALSLPIAYSSTPCAKYHWIADSKSTSKRPSIDHHPFYHYIMKRQDKDELLRNIDGLRMYLEMEELNMAYINLIAGNKQFVRENLNFVQSKCFAKRKMLLNIFNLLPNFMLRQIPVVKLNTLDRMRCLIAHYQS